MTRSGRSAGAGDGHRAAACRAAQPGCGAPGAVVRPDDQAWLEHHDPSGEGAADRFLAAVLQPAVVAALRPGIGGATVAGGGLVGRQGGEVGIDVDGGDEQVGVCVFGRRGSRLRYFARHVPADVGNGVVGPGRGQGGEIRLVGPVSVQGVHAGQVGLGPARVEDGHLPVAAQSLRGDGPPGEHRSTEQEKLQWS
ncbi:hypothetical protein PV336_43905 [Streptomyces sp. MI02-2A]|uniref:hypothetical protein n=1 Tax=Streptomyces sp. MI02-2A TaxID=3028688 RepID=UPI0029ACF263|nr:hypothetical protein [Streptomyces sp. MI02-2A]MDX3266018.1 hypothetical protein [Streptomyces sp. MI02-2A]